MLEERDILHKWESRKIVVEKKNINLAQSVTETILSYRWYLLNKVIEENKNNITADVTVDNTEILTTIKDYLSLTTVIAKNLGRVMARF
jgi:DNA primase